MLLFKTAIHVTSNCACTGWYNVCKSCIYSALWIAFCRESSPSQGCEPGNAACVLASVSQPNQSWLNCYDCSGCYYIFNSFSYQNITSEFLYIFPSVYSYIDIYMGFLLSNCSAFPKPTLKEYKCYKIRHSETINCEKFVWEDCRRCPCAHT